MAVSKRNDEAPRRYILPPLRHRRCRLKAQQQAGLLNKVPAPDTVSPQEMGDVSVVEKGPFSSIVDPVPGQALELRNRD
jgi:hypothetical protein